MQRVLRWDGLLPYAPDQELTPALIMDMKNFIDQNRQADTPFDIVVEGKTPGDQPQKAREMVQPWEQAGATWWI